MENKLTLEDLKKMTALHVPEDERVKNRFVSIYNTIQKSRDGEYFYEKEKFNLLRVVSQSEDLRKCTAFSVYGVFIDIAAMGLSLDQTGTKLLYVLSYNQKIGVDQDGKDIWEKRAMIEISPYGELALRIQSGQLKYADSPVIVYEGDTFQPLINDSGQKIVRYQALIPRKEGKKIIGSFIRLVRPDGSVDFFHMLEGDIDRLKGYSKRKNRDKGANALYNSNDGQIDSGFLEAKTIKHAFDTFPSLRLGQFSKLQVTEDKIQPTDYGLADTPVTDKQVPAETFDEKGPDPEPEGVVIPDKSEVF
jgi:hypothetical protein